MSLHVFTEPPTRPLVEAVFGLPTPEWTAWWQGQSRALADWWSFADTFSARVQAHIEANGNYDTTETVLAIQAARSALRDLDDDYEQAVRRARAAGVDVPEAGASGLGSCRKNCRIAGMGAVPAVVLFVVAVAFYALVRSVVQLVAAHADVRAAEAKIAEAKSRTEALTQWYTRWDRAHPEGGTPPTPAEVLGTTFSDKPESDWAKIIQPIVAVGAVALALFLWPRAKGAA